MVRGESVEPQEVRRGKKMAYVHEQIEFRRGVERHLEAGDEQLHLAVSLVVLQNPVQVLAVGLGEQHLGPPLKVLEVAAALVEVVVSWVDRHLRNFYGRNTKDWSGF